MMHDLTESEIEAALRDQENWPGAATRAMGSLGRNWHLAILVATIRKQAVRIEELKAENARLRAITAQSVTLDGEGRNAPTLPLPRITVHPPTVAQAGPLAPPPEQNPNFPAQLAD